MPHYVHKKKSFMNSRFAVSKAVAYTAKENKNENAFFFRFRIRVRRNFACPYTANEYKIIKMFHACIHAIGL